MKKIYLLTSMLLFTSGILLAQVNTLTQSFDAAAPAGWVATNNSNPNVPTTVWTSGSTSTSLPGYTGAGYAVVNYQSTTGAGDISNWFISPQVNLKDGAILTFYTRTAASATVYADRMEVRLSTAGASTNVGTSSTDVGDFTILACSVNPALSNSSTSTGGCGNPYPQAWTQYTVTVSGVGSTPVAGRIAFRYWVTNGGPSGANSNIIGLDELVYSNESCTTPTAGTASAPPAACANTAFDLTLTGYSPITGVDIQWQSSPVGAGTWTNIAGATSATSSVSQTAATDYRASIACSGGGTPVYSNVVMVDHSMTNCPPACTNNTTPANNATGVSYQPNIPLAWTAATGATSYDVYFGTTTTPPLLGNTANTSVNITGGVANTLYYWYVVPKNANGGLNNCSSSMTSFTTGAPAPPPANDDCASAIAINSYMGPVNGTTISGTASTGVAACGAATTWGTPDEDVWYSFTAVQNGDATIVVTGGSGFDGVLQVFSGTCGSLVQMGTCTDGAVAGPETATVTGLVAGQTYYLRVYDWDAGAGSTFTVEISGAAMPVNFATFTGRTEGAVNRLNWITATETNNKGFELQRSADGRNYTSIASVASKASNGNSTSQLTYAYTDARPLAGNNYYRLKQVDIDGRFSYSGVVELKSKSINIKISSVYPNPVKNELNLIITSPSIEKATIVVTDLSGKVISQKALELTIGDNQQQLNVQSLASGTYLVKLICANGCETSSQRFIKY